MSLRRGFASYSYLRAFFPVIHSTYGRPLNPNHVLQDVPTRQKQNHSFHANQEFRYLITSNSDSQNEHWMKIGRMTENGAVQGSLGPTATPSRGKTNRPSWGRWILGIMLSVILPFWNNKWEKLLKIEAEMEMVEEMVENAAEVVQSVATVTENLSTMAAEKIPEEDRKLKDAVLFVKHVSEELVKDAQLTKDFIHKVDELKQEVETLIKPNAGKGVKKLLCTNVKAD